MSGGQGGYGSDGGYNSGGGAGGSEEFGTVAQGGGGDGDSDGGGGGGAAGGGAGAEGGDFGGTGGRGGANGATGASGFTAATTIAGATGATGGPGGASGASSGGGGGGGGEGGYGAVLQAGGGDTVTAIVEGGTGGQGGLGGPDSLGGAGGDGGLGLFVKSTASSPATALDVTGMVKGGTGGAAGASGTGNTSTAMFGAGGVGIVGANLAVTVAGTVAGGFANAGAGAQADAIDYTGGTNSLTLSQNGTAGTLDGNIAVGGSLTVDPGTGAGGSVTLANALVDYTNPSTQAVTAGSLVKAGAGTLVLTGANQYSGGTTIMAGTLDLAGPADVDFEGPQLISGSAGTGGIAFAAPTGATLAIAQSEFATGNGTTHFYNAISGFAAAQNNTGGDTIDLTGLSNGAATFNNGVLTVTGTSNGVTKSETLNLTGNYNGDQFSTASDGNGGTDVTVNQVAGPTVRLADDTGLSNTDGVTNDDALTGTAAANTTVTFVENGTTLGTTTANAQGVYNFTPMNLPQGDQTVTASQTVAGATETGSLAFDYVTTDPNITGLAVSGPGIDGNGNGDLGAGKTVTLTVTTSEPVYVSGGTPTLTLNDNATATYTGGSGTAQQTFSYTVAPGQNTAALSVKSVNANGATVTDLAGNPVNPFSFNTATKPSGKLTIDTTPPIASSVTDTAAQNSGPTPIGLAAPSDNLTPAGSLAIAVSSLPSDGTVTLIDGLTPVTVGESLTATQLAGLEFTPRAAQGASSTFTYSVTDGAGNSSIGAATLNVGAPNTLPAGTSSAHGTVLISQQIDYYKNVFTLSGTASPGAGPVEISAIIDNGQRQDLGTAAVNANGTWTFQDKIGDNLQTFFTATQADGAQSTGPLFSLQGGLGPRGQVGQETLYGPGGASVYAVRNFSGFGQGFQNEQAPSQTVDLQPYDVVSNNYQASNTFVYTPTPNATPQSSISDTINNFKSGGADHDTLAIPSSVFGNFHDLMGNTVFQGGNAVITDPTTGTSIQLSGVSAATLTAHPKDFTFG